jgi:hypothetical protein
MRSATLDGRDCELFLPNRYLRKYCVYRKPGSDLMKRWNRISWPNDRAVLAVLASPFKSKVGLEAENAVLRHQLIVLGRRHVRVRLTNHDRWFLIQLYRWLPSILKVLTIVHAETLLRWHRAGFRCYWRGKSRSLGGRRADRGGSARADPADELENPLWGVPRIHGEPQARVLRSRSRASPSTWSSAVDRQARDGERSCVTTHRTLPRWIYSWFRPLALACSTPS